MFSCPKKLKLNFLLISFLYFDYKFHNQTKKKIRIAYYSADFRNHPMSYLLANLYELHDKNKFEVIGISFGPDKDDKMRKRVSNAFDQFINVKFKTDKEIAQLSRKLNIDIAIDLMGFVKNNRFKRKKFWIRARNYNQMFKKKIIQIG